MENSISRNVKNIQISGIRKFFNKVSEVPEAVSLTIGQPDFNVPKAIKEKMVEAIVNDLTTYTKNDGMVELREEISKYLLTQNIGFSSEEICVTCGGSEGILATLMALIESGDGVLLPDPAYPAYESCTKLIDGEVITYSLDENFQPNFDEIEEKIELLNPKVLVVSYPCNPTGSTMTKETYERLSEIVENNDIMVISDEMYSSLVYSEKYYSLAQNTKIKNKVVVIGGFSKMFSMTGLRIGYVCANKIIKDEVTKVHQYNTSCAPSIAQIGAIEGLKNSMDDVEHMKNVFKERRDYVYSELVDMGFESNMPEGAFYIFPSIKKFSRDSEEFCERLLREGKVAVVPGSAFGSAGEGYIRISYCYSLEKLKEAMSRLKEFLKVYDNK